MMKQRWTALIATVAAWLAVLVAVFLSIFLERAMWILVAFTAITALSVTLFWGRRVGRMSL
ncbi:hypothetical protein [uncultured Kocuria sp.]|uniref:hypothetical protein n=1 Tax=uncultured Kocuria sp. TaxID=259305 RepID=UPI00259A11B3|nr:hypothetical protein [uncultured Kocuria sp.]MCT1367041.1 hypothetical protein [Rothia sp. p3-SID1597]